MLHSSRWITLFKLYNLEVCGKKKKSTCKIKLEKKKTLHVTMTKQI